MNTVQKIKSFLKNQNPLYKKRCKDMSRALKNKTPSFLCPNCIGGILFHDLGIQFRSPTVNLMMLQRDFLKFVLNINNYLSCTPLFFKHSEYTCPCARFDDIVIHFTHYHDEKDALKSWERRTERIDFDNLFIFLEERDGLTYEDILSLKNVKAKGLVVFTAHDYPDIPYTVYIPKYRECGEVGNILRKSLIDGHREYEEYFDFVKWFNEAYGDFDVSHYVKKH